MKGIYKQGVYCILFFAVMLLSLWLAANEAVDHEQNISIAEYII
jgi:hypothetical protein